MASDMDAGTRVLHENRPSNVSIHRFIFSLTKIEAYFFNLYMNVAFWGRGAQFYMIVPISAGSLGRAHHSSEQEIISGMDFKRDSVDPFQVSFQVRCNSCGLFAQSPFLGSSA